MYEENTAVILLEFLSLNFLGSLSIIEWSIQIVLWIQYYHIILGVFILQKWKATTSVAPPSKRRKDAEEYSDECLSNKYTTEN